MLRVTSTVWTFSEVTVLDTGTVETVVVLDDTTRGWTLREYMLVLELDLGTVELEEGAAVAVVVGFVLGLDLGTVELEEGAAVAVVVGFVLDLDPRTVELERAALEEGVEETTSG